jgi:hypothetical protein
MRTTLAAHVLEDSAYSGTPTPDATTLVASNHTRNLIIAVNIKVPPVRIPPCLQGDA